MVLLQVNSGPKVGCETQTKREIAKLRHNYTFRIRPVFYRLGSGLSAHYTNLVLHCRSSAVQFGESQPCNL